MKIVSLRRIPRMRRFLMLALVAWLALVVNPVGAMPMSMTPGAVMPSTDVFPVAVFQSQRAHCHHADSAPAKLKSCCEGADHPCIGAHDCACAATCGGAALLSGVLDLRLSVAVDAPSRRLYAIALAMRWAPPLRPPAA